MASFVSFPAGLQVLRIYDSDLSKLKKSQREAFEKYKTAKIKAKGTTSPFKMNLSLNGPTGTAFFFSPKTETWDIEIMSQAIGTKRGTNFLMDHLELVCDGDHFAVRETKQSIRGSIEPPSTDLSLREAIQDALQDEPRELHEIRLLLPCFNPNSITKALDQLKQSGRVHTCHGEYKWAEPVPRHRPSFRDEVRTYLEKSGGEVPREDVIAQFERAGVRKTKITIALNELIARREAVYRSGVYKLTERSIHSDQ